MWPCSHWSQFNSVRFGSVRFSLVQFSYLAPSHKNIVSGHSAKNTPLPGVQEQSRIPVDTISQRRVRQPSNQPWEKLK